jgi:hypothetical protein
MEQTIRTLLLLRETNGGIIDLLSGVEKRKSGSRAAALQFPHIHLENFYQSLMAGSNEF